MEIENRIVKTKLVDIKNLNAFQGKAKTIDQVNTNKLRKLLIEEGFSFSCHVWENAGKIWVIDGHQRLYVLRSLQKEGYKIPKITCTFISAHDFKAAKKLVLMAISQYGKLDKEGFHDFIGHDEFDFSDFDFPNIADDFFIENETAIDVTLSEEDDYVPEIPNNIFGVKRGDVWTMGNHILMCGDATNDDDVEILLGGVRADMLFTDPPYGMSYSGGRTGNPFGEIKGDSEDPTKFYDMLKHAPEIYMWGRPENWQHLPDKPKYIIAWVKNMMGLGAGYRGQFELCFYYGSFKGSDSNVWMEAKARDYVHPTQKPITLALRAIKNSKPKTVLDLFLGSGSTLIACEKVGVNCFGMELDEHYCSIVIKRWEDFTNQKAIRTVGG